MKKKVLSILTLFFILALVGIVGTEVVNLIKNKKNTNEKVQVTEEQTLVSEDCYSYSDVSYVVSYLSDDDDKKKQLERLVDPLTASYSINVSYIKNIVSTIEVPEDVYIDILDDMSDEDLVTKEQFDQIYHNIANTGLVEGLTRHDVFVFNMTSETDASGNTYDVVTDGKDTYLLDVEIPSEYLNKNIDVYMKNDRIFKVNGYSDAEFIINNALLLFLENGQCTILYENMTKTFFVAPESSNTDAIKDVEDKTVVSLAITNEGITSLSEYEDVITARVLSVGDEIISLEDKGNLKYSDNFKIYNVANAPFCESSKNILKGYNSVTIFKSGETAVAALVTDEMVATDVRVILCNDSYNSYDLPYVQVTSEYAFKVIYPEEEVTINGGDVVTINYEDFESGDEVTIESAVKDGKLKVLNLNRTCGNPVYFGKLEVNIESECVNVINVVPLEKYLYSVVSSMITGETNEEAIKAMAVCARGYAYSKILDGSFSDYDAHLDDSSLSQLYGDALELPEAKKAVKDTYGVVPVYEGQVIVPLTFSTSCGVTCTNEDIWGGSSYPYLTSNVETLEKETIDLSLEEDFIKFIEDSMGFDTIEKNMPYYRWDVVYTQEEISEAVNSMLEERINMSSDNINITMEDGSSSKDVTNIGQITDIEITERSSSGVILALVIKSNIATVEITGQTNIRNLITPVNQQIVRQDGKAITGWTSLPSPFYYVEKTSEGFIIHGGGFGHGAGMSLNGANILAESGQNYKYILRHYYSYIDFSDIYVFETKDEEE